MFPERSNLEKEGIQFPNSGENWAIFQEAGSGHKYQEISGFYPKTKDPIHKMVDSTCSTLGNKMAALARQLANGGSTF